MLRLHEYFMSNRRHILKKIGAGTSLIAVGSITGSADSEVDWKSYEKALSDRYNGTEAGRAIELAKNIVNDPSDPSSEEIKELHLAIASDSQTGTLGEDFNSITDSRSGIPVHAGTAPNAEGTIVDASRSSNATFTSHTRNYNFKSFDKTKESAGYAFVDSSTSQERFAAESTSTLIGSSSIEVQGTTGEITQLYNTEYEATIEPNWVVEGIVQNNPNASFEAYFEIVNGKDSVVERRLMCALSADGRYDRPGDNSITFIGDRSREWYIRVRIIASSQGGIPNADPSVGVSTANFQDGEGGLYMPDVVVHTLGVTF